MNNFTTRSQNLVISKEMINALLGIKKNMTSTYDSRGRRVGATILEIQPNLITQIKTSRGKDGYDSIQLGFGTKKSVKKPQIGLGKKIGIEQPIRWFREIKGDQGDGGDPSTHSTNAQGRTEQGRSATSSGQVLKPGQQVKLDQVFSIGDAVKVSGTSRGRGFQGGVRRHGFHGGPKTHGQSDRHRAPGAIGSGTTPGRVYKGKRMAGHMGSRGASIKNLEVVGLDKTKNLLIVKGGIPGSVNGLVMVTKLGRVKGYTPPPEEKPEEEGEEVKEESKAEEAPKEEVTENAS